MKITETLIQIQNFTLLKTVKKGYSLFTKSGVHIPSPSSIMKPITYKKFKNIPPRILKLAGLKGKNIHDAIEISLENNLLIAPIENYPHWQGFIKFYKQHKIQPLKVEMRLVEKKLKFGGAIDFIGFLDDELVILDWKTSAKIDKWIMGLQLFIYDLILKSFEINVDYLAIIWLKKDGNFEIVKIDKAYFPLFKTVLKALLIINEFEGLIDV